MNFKPFPFEIILDWYKTNGRHELPWRINQTPYHVWISEIFLQQTQVSRVEWYFKKVIEAFPDIESFAKLEYDDFFPYYEWLGYYSRARNMLLAAKKVINEYKWIFPNTFEELVSLPGIWPYTAQAILSFGFNQNILAFDTNIEKIFCRYYFGSRFKKLTKDQKQELQNMFVKTRISGREINAALMDFSSIIDKNELTQIDFKSYPLSESIFYKQCWKNEIKPIKTTEKFNKNEAEIIVFLHENHKIYFSSDYDEFQPFKLWISSHEHRYFIKKYFLEKYSLSLSVRPAFRKLKKVGKTYFLYHAQIQKGKSTFWEFGREEYEECLSDFTLTIQ